MKKLLCPCLVLAILTLPVLAQQPEKYPKPTGYVNDFAGVVEPEYARRIEALGQELAEKTGAQLVLVTVKNLNGNDVQDFANRLFKAWGIGQKGKDNGLLMVDAMEDRRVWIEVGYGLEGLLPDGKVGSILDQYVVPELRAGNRGAAYYGGLAAAADVIAADAGVTLGGERPAPVRSRGSRSDYDLGDILRLLPLLLIFLFIFGRRGGGGCLWPMIFMGMGGGRGFGGGGFGGGLGGGGFGGGFGGFGGGGSGGGGAGRGY
jgi:uncharacterized protein